MQIANRICSILRQNWQKYKSQFYVLMMIYLLAFYPIFRANFGYVDDIGRTYAGYHGWLDWSRWSTELLATFVHAGWRLTDISPIPQVIACAIMSAGGILLLDLFAKKQKITGWNIAATALTALAPYFLGIISYKFDSPYMALSFLVSLIPFLFRTASNRMYMVTSVFCLLIMCTTYQASSGIYPVIVLFLTVMDINEGGKLKKSLEFLCISAVSYLGALVIFWFILMRNNGLSMFSLSGLIPNVFYRYRQYYKNIYQDFTGTWRLLLVVLIIFFVASVCESSQLKKEKAAALGILTLLAGSFLCFGAYLFISEEAYDARAMYGFNIWITLLAVYISFHAKYWFQKLSYLILAWSFFVFCLTYGNALAQQKDYTNFRMELLVNDLNELEIMKIEGVKRVRIEGDIGKAPVVMKMIERYPLLNRMMFTGLGGGYWGEYYFLHYLGIPNIEAEEEGYEKELPTVKDAMYHTIKGEGTHIKIELK